MSTVYTDRLVDLLVFQYPKANGQVPINLELGDGYVCTGIQKCAQTFLTLLLSADGRGAPGTGSSRFLNAVRNGYIRNDGDVQFYFTLAVDDILGYLNNNGDYKTAPNDEVLTGATLLSFFIQEDRLYLNIQVESAAGDSREVILPISAVPA